MLRSKVGILGTASRYLLTLAKWGPGRLRHLGNPAREEQCGDLAADILTHCIPILILLYQTNRKETVRLHLPQRPTTLVNN
jgi:hypothetical protein